MAWLWAFLAFLALAVVSIRREVPVFLPPPAAEAGAVSQTPSPESAAVLPFSETLTASPYAVGLDIGKPTERPEALRREPDGSLVCELGAGSNHLGGLDGRALARALGDELAAAGVFSSVRYAEGEDELKDESVLIRGKVLDGVLRIKKDGSREYELAVELTAERSFAPQRREIEPFWRRTFRKSARGGTMGAAYEVGGLVRKLYGDVGRDLGQALGNGI